MQSEHDANNLFRSLVQNLILELWKRQSACHAVTRRVETASLWRDKRLRHLWHWDSVAQLPSKLSWDRYQSATVTQGTGSVCVIFPYLLTTDLWVFVWAGRTVLPLIGKLISRQGAGCAHPVNTVTSINWLVCFTAPIYFNIALLPVHQPALKMCDAAPWQCQKLFQLPLRRRKCCGVKAPFISQLMSCGLLHITDQTLRCRIGEVWGGNEW